MFNDGVKHSCCSIHVSGIKQLSGKETERQSQCFLYLVEPPARPPTCPRPVRLLFCLPTQSKVYLQNSLCLFAIYLLSVFLCVCAIRTCSLFHWILPMHLAAFLQAVLVPKLSSFSVKSYVPLFSICFITSVRRFWWAGLFSLLIQRLRVQTGRGASSKQTTRGTEKRRQRIQYTNKSYLQFHGCVILREEVQGLYLDFFCWSRDSVRSLWSHFRPIRLHQRALTASCRTVDRLPLRRMAENVSYSSCNVTLCFLSLYFYP